MVGGVENRGAMQELGHSVYEKYLYLSLNCVIDLKVLKKVTNKPKREASEYGLDLEAQIRSK